MKKRLLLFWRILVAAGMVSILFLAGLFVYEFMRDQRKLRYTCSSQYSDSYHLEWYKGTVRIKSVETGKYMTPALNHIYDRNVKDTLTVFFHKNKRGFLDVYTGKIVIPALYDRAWIFSEGLGAVVKEGKLGFINKKGDVVIPFQFAFQEHWTKRVDFLFKGGLCTVIDSTGKHGLIDKTGKWVVMPHYDYINNPENGLRIVKKDRKYGVMDESLQWRLPIEYDWIMMEREGFIVRNNNEQQLLAMDGKTVLQPFVYNSTNILHYNSGKVNEAGEDIFVKSDYRKFSVNGKSGLMDNNGKVTVPAIYGNISALGNDLFSCKIVESNFYITINGRGEAIQ